MENETLEIYDISVELQKLAHCGVLPQRTANACAQASALLTTMREVILTVRSDTALVAQLKDILSKQGEG
jgi:hypothetical protein